MISLPESNRRYGVITSDHGFIELLRTRAIVVPGSGGKAPDDTAEVEHRYISENDKGISVSPLTVTAGETEISIAVGSSWFKREGVSTFPRYNHGGCSLAEMVIPGALLRRLTGKVSRVVVEGLPAQLVGRRRCCRRNRWLHCATQVTLTRLCQSVSMIILEMCLVLRK